MNMFAAVHRFKAEFKQAEERVHEALQVSIYNYLPFSVGDQIAVDIYRASDNRYSPTLR